MSYPEASYACSDCGFDLWVPIGMLRVSVVGLHDDARFPGRCIVALLDHYEFLEELPTELLVAFVQDIQTAGRAVRTAVSAKRLNYAILGNVQPHLHAHLIPRGVGRDILMDRTPWEHPEDLMPLKETVRRQIVGTIQDALVVELEQL